MKSTFLLTKWDFAAQLIECQCKMLTDREQNGGRDLKGEFYLSIYIFKSGFHHLDICSHVDKTYSWMSFWFSSRFALSSTVLRQNWTLIGSQ